jgi:NADH-ubiquinone oxidoreductase chain 5
MIYNNYITNVILKLGGQTTKVLDRGSVEIIGPYGLEKLLVSLNSRLSRLGTGVITTYALYILIGFIVFTLLPYVISYNDNLLIMIILAVFLSVNNFTNKIY